MRDAFQAAANGAAGHRKNIVQLIGGLAYRHDAWRVFSDFVEMAAIALSNAVDLAQRPGREARYLEIVRHYERDEVEQFPKMFAALVQALEAEPSDVLGGVYHDLDLHHKYAGQFFTPDDVCRMMARLLVGDGAALRERIADRGYVTAQEPACGGGAMVIALAEELKTAGINYQQALHVTAVDVDAKCVHMAYAQFSLLHIPATVVQGNSLSLEEHGRWHTPAHILGGWRWRLQPEPQTSPVVEDDLASRPKPQGGPQLSLF